MRLCPTLGSLGSRLWDEDYQADGLWGVLLGWIPTEGKGMKQEWTEGQVELWCSLNGKHRQAETSETSWVGKRALPWYPCVGQSMDTAWDEAALFSQNHPQRGLKIEGFLPAALSVAGRMSPSFLKGTLYHSILPTTSVCSHYYEHW